MKRDLLHFILIDLILMSNLLFGQDEISISSRVDKSRITIGDLITYTVEVIHDNSIQVTMPGVGANLGGFEIRDYLVHDPIRQDDNFISKWNYIISTFFTGEFEIPPLTIQYRTEQDTTFKSLTTEPIKIVVESVKPSEAGDIKDIKPPEEIPKDFWYWGRWIVLGGVTLLLALLAFFIYRRRKAGMRLLPIREKVVRPPHEVALERLEKLRKSDLLHSGEVKVYYIELSEIIRQYIGGRYFIVALEMTTTEVLNKLKGAEVQEEDFNRFKTLFTRSDLVKFAKVIPSEKEHGENWQLAFEIIERTKLILTEDSPEEGSGNEHMDNSQKDLDLKERSIKKGESEDGISEKIKMETVNK